MIQALPTGMLRQLPEYGERDRLGQHAFLGRRYYRARLAFVGADLEQLTHLLVEKAAAGFVGLHPLAVNDELRNSAFSDIFQNFIGSARRFFDIDFGEWNLVFFEEAFGGAAIAAPGGCVHDQRHGLNSSARAYRCRGEA